MRLAALRLVISSCDISGGARPLAVHSAWADLVIKEFNFQVPPAQRAAATSVLLLLHTLPCTLSCALFAHKRLASLSHSRTLYSQVNEERALRLQQTIQPVTTLADKANMQLGFIRFLVRPAFDELNRFLTADDFHVKFIDANFAHW